MVKPERHHSPLCEKSSPLAFTERVFIYALGRLIIYKGNFAVLVLRALIHIEVWFVIEAGPSSIPGPLIEYW